MLCFFAIPGSTKQAGKLGQGLPWALPVLKGSLQPVCMQSSKT